VECWVARDPDSKINKDIRQLWEAEYVASRIVEVKKEGTRFGDIAVLLKNFTDVSVYERALRGKGIPYTVIAGRGFYQKTEILDTINFLKVIENPWDDIALVSVLRSPLVDLSDDGILFLAQERSGLSKQGDGEGKSPLWSAIRLESFWKNLTPKDKWVLKTFLDLQVDLQNRKSQMRIQEILREIILRTFYDTKVLLEAIYKIYNLRTRSVIIL